MVLIIAINESKIFYVLAALFDNFPLRMCDEKNSGQLRCLFYVTLEPRLSVFHYLVYDESDENGEVDIFNHPKC